MTLTFIKAFKTTNNGSTFKMNDSRIRTPKKPLPEIPVRREDYENHRLDQYVAVSPPIHPLTEKSKLARLGLKK